MIARRLAITAPHNHAVAVAEMPVADRAINVEPFLAAVERRPINGDREERRVASELSRAGGRRGRTRVGGGTLRLGAGAGRARWLSGRRNRSGGRLVVADFACVIFAIFAQVA